MRERKEEGRMEGGGREERVRERREEGRMEEGGREERVRKGGRRG